MTDGPAAPVPADPAAPGWLLVTAVAAGGAVGAVVRYGVSRWAVGRFPEHAWLGTLAVNLAGCFLIGAATYAAAEKGTLSPAARAAVISGFLGGLTTFSTFGLEAVALGRGAGGRGGGGAGGGERRRRAGSGVARPTAGGGVLGVKTFPRS